MAEPTQNMNKGTLHLTEDEPDNEFRVPLANAVPPPPNVVPPPPNAVPSPPNMGPWPPVLPTPLYPLQGPAFLPPFPPAYPLPVRLPPDSPFALPMNQRHQLSLDILEAARRESFSDIDRIMGNQVGPSLRMSEEHEYHLLVAAVRYRRWRVFLYLVQTRYRYHHCVVEAALLSALEQRQYAFVHTVASDLADVHVPWSVLLKGVEHFAQSDLLLEKVDALLHRLPLCVDLDQLRKIHWDLQGRRVPAERESSKQLALFVMATVVKDISSKTTSE